MSQLNFVANQEREQPQVLDPLGIGIAQAGDA